MGRRTKFEEPVIRELLKEARRGTPVKTLCDREGLSLKTFYRWKRKYPTAAVAELEVSADLERENEELKKLVAELLLENRRLRQQVDVHAMRHMTDHALLSRESGGSPTTLTSADPFATPLGRAGISYASCAIGLDRSAGLEPCAVNDERAGARGSAPLHDASRRGHVGRPA